MQKDKGKYYFWAKTQKTPGAQLRKYIWWVEAHYDVNEHEKKLTNRAEGHPDWETARLSRQVAGTARA